MNNLTNTELEILELVGLGYSNRQIAKQLHYSYYTIRKYVSDIICKLGAKNRTHAVFLYYFNPQNQFKFNFRITKREFEVLKLVVLGYNNREIAKMHGISKITAKAYVNSLLDKTDIHNRTKLTYYMAKEGYHPLNPTYSEELASYVKL